MSFGDLYKWVEEEHLYTVVRHRVPPKVPRTVALVEVHDWGAHALIPPQPHGEGRSVCFTGPHGLDEARAYVREYVRSLLPSAGEFQAHAPVEGHRWQYIPHRGMGLFRTERAEVSALVMYRAGNFGGFNWAALKWHPDEGATVPLLCTATSVISCAQYLPKELEKRHDT